MLVKVFLSLAALAVYPTLVTNNFRVPDQYRGNTTAKVVFTDKAGIEKHCAKSPNPDLVTVACVNHIGGHVIFISNPCADKDADDPTRYAHVLCHELAHTNGWEHPI